ncbi:MAG: hypothetical protein K2W80_10140 [Burkholderiales bacterium]|nr:hypothetical protein [Burkholderiales bacterium]
MKIRIYLFYVAAVAFVSIGLWMIGAGLFSTGGFTALVVGGLMFATGVVDFAMGRYLQRQYLYPTQQQQAQQPAPPGQSSAQPADGGGAGSPGGGSAA